MLKGHKILIAVAVGIALEWVIIREVNRMTAAPTAEERAKLPAILMGAISNNMGGKIDVFELQATPAGIYCLVAVSGSTQRQELYPSLVCVNR
jgi:hypothetical protein